MSTHFQRPTGIIQRQSKFSNREVGFNHQDQPGYFKIADNGDIIIMADDGLGIVISKAKRTIFLIGNHVKFLTNNDEGVKFNQYTLNHHATVFTEPALIESKNTAINLYDGIENYLD